MMTVSLPQIEDPFRRSEYHQGLRPGRLFLIVLILRKDGAVETDIDGSIQKPERPSRNGTRPGATNRRHSAPTAEPPPVMRRGCDEHVADAGNRRLHKPPGLGVGVLLMTSARDSTKGPRLTPNQYQKRTEQTQTDVELILKQSGKK